MKSPSKSIKYLVIKIDENLNSKQHIHDIAIKLNRANTLLPVIRNYVYKHTLRTIYFVIFDSHINYINLIWDQNLHALSRTVILQKKDLRVIILSLEICNYHAVSSTAKIFKPSY